MWGGVDVCAMELLVLREGVHRRESREYAAALDAKLDDHHVRHARTPSEERDYIESADIATGVQIDEALLEQADNLRWFACVYAGTSHLPLAALQDAGIAVTNAAGVHAPNASEHAVGLLLTFARNLHLAAAKTGWEPTAPSELAGSTVTIVGLGAIGSAIADRLAPFNVTTLGVRKHPSTGGPTDEVVGPDALHDVLARTDYLVLCCPLTPATEGLIGQAELATLPPDAVIVNVARGPVVETDALLSALHRGRIGGAALDVTDPEPLPDDHPLWTFSNVVITPHSAGSTPKYYTRLADIVAENIERFNTDQPLRNQVSVGETTEND